MNTDNLIPGEYYFMRAEKTDEWAPGQFIGFDTYGYTYNYNGLEKSEGYCKFFPSCEMELLSDTEIHCDSEGNPIPILTCDKMNATIQRLTEWAQRLGYSTTNGDLSEIIRELRGEPIKRLE